MIKFDYVPGIYTERRQRAPGRPPVTCFRLDACGLDKWMAQNGADYTGDFVAGCLLDSFVAATRRGYAAVYENYVNTWTSDYYIEFQPGAATDVWDAWNEYEAQYGEAEAM